ncbi:hypothetical protein [Pedobacter sp. MR2016-24]|uniref:hypothetical protein n=1 Tax=Pedobacter sp. MR2016-24 TaxID=2994466 RepID=UPI0022460AF1|nr:hypothetical protein [Pedobacter sp. MR2016-24]MCX2483523.1 hypothetical protein [Pedobacter sp. MR2016-24]
MKVKFGPKILLPTKYGDFDITHVEVNENGTLMREGVLLGKEPVDKEKIYVRVQSSCLFSESFWTTDCDCSMQLQSAMEFISQNGGYVLYFYEEGRGAGLKIKFQAIELQQLHKYDTRKAYECLNVNVDARTFEASADVLKAVIGKQPIILMTNNPGKVDGLVNNGIVVNERMPLICGLDSDARKEYLAEKVKALGHIIEGL